MPTNRHSRPVRPHVAAAKLGFGLRLKHGFLDLDRHCRDHAVAYVGIVEILLEILLDCARDRLFECRKVCSALSCMLSVDKRVIFLTALVGMGYSHLDILPF